MKYTLLPIAFATGLSVSAMAIKRDACFTLNTKLGYISTSTEGQNTIGVAPNGPTQYCISAHTLSVQNGPECLVDTSDNQRFQCSDFDNIKSTSNFSIADNNDLLYNGCPNFFACSQNMAGSSYTVLADSAHNTGNCTSLNIQLAGFSGTSMGGSTNISSTVPSATGTPTSIALSSTPATVTPFLPSTPTTVAGSVVTSAATGTVGGVTCPTDLSQGAIAPNLFVHIRSSNTNYTSGPSPNVTVTPSDSSVLAFDVPTTYTDTCALLFMFPYSSALNASDKLNPYQFSGTEEEEGESGGLVFSLLAGAVHNGTTYGNKPAISKSYGKTEIVPGNGYTITTMDCKWAESAYQIDSAGGVSLIYDQDADNSPVGLFIVHCNGSSAP